MENIKLVIFDLDGTLADAYRAIYGSFNYTMNKLHYPPRSESLIRRSVGWGDENLLRPFVKARDLDQALKIYRRHHKTALLKGSRLLPGVGKTLNYLKAKGLKLAVASNRPTAFSRIIIRCLGLKKYINYLLCADKLKKGKPDPEILNRIMDKYSVSRAQTVYVGDMFIDAEAGRRAGVKTAIVTTGSSTAQEIRKERPWRVIKKFDRLLKIL